MTKFDELQSLAQSIVETVQAIDLKLDEVRTHVENLGNNPSEAQIDALFQTLEQAKSSTQAVLQEASAVIPTSGDDTQEDGSGDEDTEEDDDSTGGETV